MLAKKGSEKSSSRALVKRSWPLPAEHLNVQMREVSVFGGMPSAKPTGINMQDCRRKTKYQQSQQHQQPLRKNLVLA